MPDAEAKLEAAKMKYLGKVVKGTRLARSIVGLVSKVRFNLYDENEIFLELLSVDGLPSGIISLQRRVVTIAGEDE